MKNGEGRKSRDLNNLGPTRSAPRQPVSTTTSQTLELLRGLPGPVDLTSLAEIVALHPNTVREHLGTLIGHGLVNRRRADPHGRGRPAWLYEARPATSQAQEYVGLTIALSAAILRTSRDPRQDAEQAGESWGRDLARQRGAAPTTPEDARERAVEVLDDLGFAPLQDDPTAPATVRLTRCPLLDAARENPRIVCTVHLGMLRGVLAEYGADPSGSDLVAFAEPGACLLVVPPTP